MALVMIDFIKLSVPFKDSYTMTTKEVNGVSTVYVDIQECAVRGVPLEARNIEYVGGTDNSGYEISDIRHPYESLPSSFSGLSFKIFQGTPLRPACVELKGSPAKLLQGHNVYGSTSLSTGAVEMLMILMHNYPDFYEMLNIQDTLLDAIDCTYSAKLANEVQCKQVIQLLKNISNGHVRSSVKNEYESTTYFNRNSRHVDRKVYLKYPEFKKQLDFYNKMTQKGDSRYTRLIDVMSNPQLINYSRNLIRFESRAHRRYLDKFEVPHKLFDAIKFQYEYEENGSSLIKDIWIKSWDKVFDTFKGEKMNFNNDEEIRDKLRSVHFSYTPKGNISYNKADRLFIFFKLILNEGYESAKLLVPKATFNRNVKALVDSGLSKAQLQNLKSQENNVVPLVNIIDVNFENQRPSDFIEPIGELTKLYNFPVEELRVAS